ncbi:integrase arm-type DNA-binding domain-containing protein [Phenylobacterium sp. J426]|uniref:tyrosine-type recombinase/integrase n=1 Tax=Phenylobacterium sp. J426 TaxID=2898439 RepID=UPI002150AE45|nr:tyrosine-type recombinase/integrase [Phenylobacterium sp. J426]MCR5876281.1 integrase arm-type DNA-binding domain-containing protein [Phenylobacterium sp. J426]
MAKARQALTHQMVDEAGPGHRDIWLWDPTVAGFGVKITPAGRRIYVLQYRFEGRSRRYTIGRHGSPWRLETARARARILLAEIASGSDPQEGPPERKALTVAALCDLYLLEGLATAKKTSIAPARSRIKNHIKPLLGTKPASGVSRADVERMMVAIAEGATRRRIAGPRRGETITVRGGQGTASASVAVLSAVYSFAVRRELAPSNPAYGVRKYRGRKMERYLSPEELRRLGEVLSAAEALGVQSPYALAAIRTILLTGCRVREVLTLQHAHVDRRQKLFRLPDSKTGPKVVHVGSEVLAVIDGLPRIEGNPYVFVGRSGVGPLVYLHSAWERVRQAAGLGDVRLHDLRHSFASMGAASGDSLLVIGALLGHRTAKSTERYAHLADGPVRGAAERISGEIARLLCAATAAPDAAAPATSPMDSGPDEMSVLLGRVGRTRWLDTRGAASRTGLSVATLSNYRWQGVGPPYRNLHNRVVYPEPELMAWIEARTAGEAIADAPFKA